MWLILSATCIGLLYLFLKNHYNYWKKRGIDTPTFRYFVGNVWDQLIFKTNQALIISKDYRKFEGYNYFGYYNLMQPTIIVRNPEVIGDVLMKDFDSFADNDFEMDDQVDPIFGRNPFMVKGQRWKQVRAQFTPAFSSGKVRAMLPSLMETNAKLLKYLEKNQNSPIRLEELTRRVTADNVATCSLGIDGGSFTDDMKFVNIANSPIAPPNWNAFKSIIVFLSPSLGHYINVGFFSKKTLSYLRNMIEEIMQYREEKKIQRNDLMDEMIQLNKKINDEKLFNIQNIIGHIGGVFIDGVITTAIASSHTLYELGRNQEIQDKLRKEINAVLNDEELTHEKLLDMEYLDCVVKESLRMHPPLMSRFRRVTKPYTMRPMKEDGTGPSLQLDVGTAVIVPVYSLHMDPKFFPEPHKFNPERWRVANKDKIVKNSYLPFSDGPRICVGIRFAILQMKVMLIGFIKNYKVRVHPKTKEPVKIDPKNFVNLPDGGYWGEFTKVEHRANA